MRFSESSESDYPYRWQGVFWHLMWATGTVSPRNHAPARELLVIARIGSERERSIGSDPTLRRIAITRLSEATAPGRVVVWDSSNHGAPSDHEIVEQLAQMVNPCLIVLDLDAITNVWKALPLRAFRLSQVMLKNRVPVYCVLWDAFDPVQAWSSQVLTRRNGGVLTLGRRAESVGNLGISNSLGSGSDLLAPDVAGEDKVVPWGDRSWDLLLPPPTHRRRQRLVADLRLEAEVSRWSMAPTQVRGYQDYLEVIANTRVTVVVNEVRERYVRTTPSRLGFRSGATHMVGRNFETVASGSLLVAQRDATLRDYLTPGVDYLEWGTPEEAKMQIRTALENPSDAQAMAENSRNRLREILVENLSARLLVNSRESRGANITHSGEWAFRDSDPTTNQRR